MKGRGSADYVVQPVDRALAVLAYVVERGRIVSLKSVSEALDLPKTTAYRYLQTLVHAGFLDFDSETEKYRSGSRLKGIARSENAIGRVREIARPLLGGLTEEFGETVNLASPGDGAVVYLELFAPSRRPGRQARVGDAHPMHSTALGKAILSSLPPDERRVYLYGPLAERTGRTLVNPSELELQLRRATDLGFATEIGENEDGMMCVGAPVLDETGYPLAAISLSAPLRRMGRGMSQAIGTRLADLARSITLQIGGQAAGQGAMTRMVPAGGTLRG